MSSTDYSRQITQVRNVAEVIADTISDLIYSAELKPGEFLRQEEMARQFDVSRVPVRDALHILERRGLVVSVPRRGVQVRPISRQQVHDLYGLRRALETFAMREVCSRGQSVELSKLRQAIEAQQKAFQEDDIAAFIDNDEAFHIQLCSMAGNQALTETVATVWARIKQVRSVARVDSLWGKQWASRSVQRHEQILSILQKGEADVAVAMTDDIIQGAAAELVEQLEKLGWLEEQN